MTKPRTDTPKSFRFSDEELALLDRAAGKAGSAKRAIILGLDAYLAGSPVTKAAVMQWIEQNTSDRSIPLGKGVRVKG